MRNEIDQEIVKEIGTKIRTERQRAGLTLANLANKIGYACSAVSNWERGIKNPSILAIKKVEKILRIKL